MVLTESVTAPLMLECTRYIYEKHNMFTVNILD